MTARLPNRCVLVRDARVAAGGFETWVETLANGLPAEGIETIVLAPGGGFTSATAEVVSIEAHADVMQQARTIVDALQQLATRGASGVFFTMGYDYINRAGLNLGNSPWCPIPVMHGRHPSAFEWIAAGPPAKIVVPSHDFARTIRGELRRRARWFRALGRVVVIPHGVPIPSIAGKLARPVESPVRVVAVMRMDEDVKRPFDYVRIAQRARERGLPADFTIAGSGPAEARLREAAGDSIRFAGSVPHDHMIPFLLDADILISTSESEAFGLAIAEALSCGCAVVAADADGPVRELVTEHTGMRVPVGDIDAFVDAIAEITPRLRKLAREGHDLVKLRFNEKQMVRSYATLIRSLAKYCKPDRAWRPPQPLLQSPSQLTLPPVAERIRRKLRR